MATCRIAALLFAGIVAVCGCGGAPTGDVSGTVQIGDQPIPFGTVAFTSTDGTVKSSTLMEGRYSISGLPVGDTRIAVQTHEPPPLIHPPTGPDGTANTRPKLTFIPIPARYFDAGTSGLQVLIRAGSQQHDVRLEP